MAALRVLVADDEAAIRMLLHRILAREGYEVTEADCGRGAEKAVKTAHAAGTPYAALVLDVHMPDLDGVALYRSLEDAGCRPPTLVITGDTRSKGLSQLVAMGCERVLEKPFSPPDAVKALREIAK